MCFVYGIEMQFSHYKMDIVYAEYDKDDLNLSFIDRQICIL